MTLNKLSWDNRREEMGSVPTVEIGAPALVFDGYRAWRSHVTLPVPYGTQAFTCIWIKNSRLASAKPIYNVRVRIEYLHDGSEEFVIQSASWWHDPPRGRAPLTWQTSIDLDANESQCVPVFMQPVGGTNLDPPWPRSALDDERKTRTLRHGRWMLRITVTADCVEPIQGEIEFTVYQEQGEGRLSIGCNPPIGAVRLPLEPEPAVPTPTPRQSHFSAVWHWVGGSWQWATLFGAGCTIIKLGEYTAGLLLLALSGFAACSKIAHWKSSQSSHVRPIRTLGYLIVAGAFIFLVLVTISLQGNEPWSHLPALAQRFLVIAGPPPFPKAPSFPPAPWAPPAPKPPAGTRAFPIIAFLYRDHTIQIHNLGSTEVTFWGTKLDKGPRSMEGPAMSLAKEPYFYYVHSDSFEQEAISKFRDGEIETLPFYAYLKDSDGRKFTAKCGLRTTVSNKIITVETQGLGTKGGWLEF